MCIAHICQTNLSHLLKYFYMLFGNNFKRLRRENGLSQKDVAGQLGVHQSNVSDWENDVSRPEYENLIQLSKIYQCTIAELLGIDENMQG